MPEYGAEETSLTSVTRTPGSGRMASIRRARAWVWPPPISKRSCVCGLLGGVIRDLALWIDEGQDVAVRILEPSGSQFSRDVHIALVVHLRQIIPLERDSLGLEVAHGAVDVRNDPCGGGRLVGSGVLRPIDVHPGAAALQGQDFLLLARVAEIDLFEAELVFVEL